LWNRVLAWGVRFITTLWIANQMILSEENSSSIMADPFMGTPSAHDPCEIILPDIFQCSEKIRRDELDGIAQGERPF
jgi:hypothetical protein